MSILTAATLGLALAWLPPSGPRTAAAAVFPAQVQAGAWTPVGPAPTTAGVSGYSEDASGRLTGIAAHPSDPQTIVVATAGGGVWKTADGGATWKPLTDGQPVLFAGAVAIARSDPSVIYAGTGEANMGPSKVDRHNIYYGRGVLRSGDGGATWSLTGAIPFDRRTISRLVVDPQDANTVYAAVGAVAVNGVAGNTGIWKTVDGGASWTNTTTAISSTAAFADLVADPRDRNILYAAVGQPDGGDVDGINRNGVYRTTDGGASWASLDFPSTAITGRVALAISRSNPAVLYSASARTTDQHFEQAASFDLATSAWTSLGDRARSVRRVPEA